MDSLSFLLESGVSAREVERLQESGISLKEQAEAARRRLERGETLESSELEAAFAAFDPFENEGCTPLPEFPVETLPDELRGYVESVAESLQVPVDMPSVIALSVIALCVQGRFVVNPTPGWIEPLNLYTATIAQPSERKSPVLSAMTGLVYAFEREENERRAPAIEEYTAKHDLLTRRINTMTDKAAKGKGEVEFNDLIAAKQELSGLEPVKPLRLISDDSTPEALASLMAQNGGRMSVISSEGGIFDIIAGKYSGSVNLDLFLKSYTGDAYRVDRKGRPSEYISHPALTMLLTFQPAVLSALMQEKDFVGRGFLARFLFSLPSSKVGKRAYRKSPVNPQAKTQYESLIYDLLSVDAAETAQVIHVDPEADAVAEEFFLELEPQLIDELEGIGGWAGKLHGTTMRIAGILHRCRYGHCAAECEINAETMQAAVSIGRYFEAHALAAFSQMGMLESQSEKDAKYILRRLIESGKAEISKRDLFNLAKGRIHKVDMLKPGLEELKRRGYICVSKNSTGGRPTEKIRLNPLAQK